MDSRFPITLPPGVVKNDSAYAVKGRYIDSHLVRSFQGRMQKWAGWGNYLSLTTGSEPGRGGLVWNTNDGETLQIYGTANRLYLYKRGVRYDITPQDLTAGLVTTTLVDTGWGGGAGWGAGPWGGGFSAVAGQGRYARVWTIQRWGEDAVMCPRGGPIYIWEYDAGDTLGVEATGLISNGTTVSLLDDVNDVTAGARVRTTTVFSGNDSFTKVLLHMDGTDAATTFTDHNEGGAAHSWTAAGNAQIDTAQSKFGGASGLFDGTGDYITTPDHADFTLGSGDFTVDFWFRCNAAGGTEEMLAGQCDASITASTVSFFIARSSGNVITALVCQGGSSVVVTGTTQFTDAVNTGWHHLAFVRTGSVLKLFIDGVQEGGDVAITGAINDSSDVLGVGTTGAVTTNTWTGWIEEFRLSVGVARWTAAFTPPTASYGHADDGIPADTFVVSVNTGAATMVISNAAVGHGDVALIFDMPAVALSTKTVDALLPTAVLGILVTDDRHLVAYGAAQAPITYDALNIAWCNREDYTVWTPTTLNTAGAIRCESGNQIMTMIRVFGGYLALTDLSAHPFTYVGGDDIFGLDRIGSQSGAIGPQAAVEMDGVGYWLGIDAHYSYNGRVNKMPCDVHKHVFDNLNKNQAYKIIAGTNRAYNELIYFWPDNTGVENNNYHAVNLSDMTWSNSNTDIGTLSRTTWIDANALFKTPIGLDGVNYGIYQHDEGTTADGVAISYLLETGEIELVDEQGTPTGDRFTRLKKVVPDYAYVTGEHNLTVYARGYPYETPVTKGPYTMVTGGSAGMFNPKARGRSFRFKYTGTGNFRQGDTQAYGAPDGGKQ